METGTNEEAAKTTESSPDVEPKQAEEEVKSSPSATLPEKSKKYILGVDVNMELRKKLWEG